MKQSIKIGFIVLFSLGFVAVFGQNTRDVGAFNKISVSTSVKVKLIKANQPKVEFKMITGDEEDLITKVKNGTLTVKIKSGMLSWSSKSKASVKVYYTELNEVDVSAGASVQAEGPIVSDDMNVEVSSGASADLEIESEDIDADVSSGARLRLEGKAESGDFDASSGANLDASAMVCDNVKADVSSGARISVHVNKKLKADASSGGSIRYKGDVDHVDTDSGWSGQIKRMR